MNDILISIIMPCYNCKDYLQQSIGSLINQKKYNFELILVDDGSTDNSISEAENILKTVKFKYSIISQQNLGVSAARNNGIKNAQGKYLYFLDADDFIASDFSEVIEELVINNKEIDLIFFNYNITKRSINKNKDILKKEIIDNKNNEALMQIFTNQFIYHICSFVSKRSFINDNNIAFTEGARYGEDVEFIIKCVSNSKCIIKDTRYLYNYYIRQGSTVHKFNEKRFDSIESAIRVNKYIEERINDDLIINLSRRYVAEKMINLLNNYYWLKSETNPEIEEKINEMILKNARYFNYINYKSKSKKMLLLKSILVLNPQIYFRLLNLKYSIKNICR